jgi:hypothetical protein
MLLGCVFARLISFCGIVLCVLVGALFVVLDGCARSHCVCENVECAVGLLVFVMIQDSHDYADSSPVLQSP